MKRAKPVLCDTNPSVCNDLENELQDPSSVAICCTDGYQKAHVSKPCFPSACWRQNPQGDGGQLGAGEEDYQEVFVIMTWFYLTASARL